MGLFKRKKKQGDVVRSITIHEKDFDKWPFRVSEATIYSMLGKSVYISINKGNYALNGFSEDVLKLKHIFKTGLVKHTFINHEKVFYSIGEFIDIGINLFTEKEIIHFAVKHKSIST